MNEYIRAHWRALLAVIIIGLLAASAAAALLFASGYLISRAALRPENVLKIYVPIVAVRTFGISRAVLRYVEKLLGHNVVLKMMANMRVAVFQRLEPHILRPSFRLTTGKVLGLIADDIEQLQNLYLKTLFPSVIALLLGGIATIVLTFFSPLMAMVLFVHLLLWLVALPLLAYLRQKATATATRAARSAQYELATDAFLGLREWQFSGKTTAILTRFETLTTAIRRDEQSALRERRWRTTISYLFVLTLLTALLIWTSGHPVANVLFAAFVLIVFPLVEVWLPVSDALAELPNYDASLAQLASLPEATAATETRDDENVALHDVTYHYDNEAVLRGVSLSVATGETVALIGRSGAGKSTIAHLLQRELQPATGTVEAPRIVAVLNQQPHLFDTTVMNNIRLGRPTASDDDVYTVAAQVGLHELISSLPLQYETPMHEAGSRFSGGERQRIALARILLQDAPFVILDEPTVGLDPLTEKQLLETIFTTLRDKRVLWITHHLATVRYADRIVLLENGKIALDGSHRALLETSDRYAKLYALR